VDVGQPLQRVSTAARRHASARARGHRFVLRYRGHDEAPTDDVMRIEHAVRVLDRTPRMILVEAGDAQLADLAAALPRWLVAREETFVLERPADGGQ
jgi:hypothetical protein